MPCGPDCEECARIQTAREKIEEYRAARVVLRDNARRVLVAILDDENRRRLQNEERVIVTGSHGGRYVVTMGYSGNVWRIGPKGGLSISFCAHPPMTVNGAVEVPVEVAMIGQILALQADEPGFLRVAN